ncbi:MAG: hypothetical protein AAED33_13455 [Paracoccaceae bacterium]|jgi:hypothetical protein
MCCDRCAAGTEAAGNLTVFTDGSSTYVLPSGKADDNQVVYEIGTDGAFSVANSYMDASATYEHWELATVITDGTDSFIYGSIWGQSGFFRFDLQVGGALTNPFMQNGSVKHVSSRRKRN